MRTRRRSPPNSRSRSTASPTRPPAAPASVALGGATQAPANASTALLQGTTIGIGRIAGTGVNFAAMVRAIRGDTNTNVVATPSAVTMDNQEAELKVAQEVPFVTGQFTNTTAVTGGSGKPVQTIQGQEGGTHPQSGEGRVGKGG